MPFATPGPSRNDNAMLERRIASLERLLNTLNLIELTTSTKKVLVLAREQGAGDGGGSAAASGAFCGLYTDNSGDIYLQGGTLSDGGGGGTPEVIDDYKVADSGGVGSLAGDVLYLKAGITAKSADGLMIPGVKLNSASFTRTTPTAHEFKTGALTGDVFIEVGRWSDDAFLPAGTCGLSRVGGCPGSYGIY